MKENKHPDFNEWLKTEDGLSCNDIRNLAEQKFLTNRLFLAFDAGRNCVWDQYLEQKIKIDELNEWKRSEIEKEITREQFLGRAFGEDEIAKKDTKYPNSTQRHSIYRAMQEYADLQVKEAEDRFRADARRILMEHWYELKTSMRSDERDKLIREFESLGKEN